MNSQNFTEISKRYRTASIVQASAADILFDLLKIRENESVLDVGCGTGNLTKKIYGLSQGRVVGIDPSPGMINESQNNFGAEIEFKIMAAEEIDYSDQFDVIFCNSAFQWIADAEKTAGNF